MAKKKELSPLTFTAVQKAYNVATPDQVKLAILWHHMQALLLHLYGDTPHNERELKKYDRHWKIAEREEIKRGAR